MPFIQTMAKSHPLALFVHVDTEKVGLGGLWNVPCIPLFKFCKNGKERESIEGFDQEAIERAVSGLAPTLAELVNQWIYDKKDEMDPGSDYVVLVSGLFLGFLAN